MAKKLKMMSTTDLVNYQQLLDFTSRELHGLYQQIDENFKKGLISRDFTEKMEESFRTRITKNNDVSMKIDVELFARVNASFDSGLTTPKELPRLNSLFQEEIKRMAAEKEKKADPKKLKIDVGNEEKK